MNGSTAGQRHQSGNSFLGGFQKRTVPHFPYQPGGPAIETALPPARGESGVDHTHTTSSGEDSKIPIRAAFPAQNRKYLT